MNRNEPAGQVGVTELKTTAPQLSPIFSQINILYEEALHYSKLVEVLRNRLDSIAIPMIFPEQEAVPEAGTPLRQKLQDVAFIIHTQNSILQRLIDSLEI